MPILALNKPYGVLSQFTDAAGRPTLAAVVPVPDVYPVGRLDMDSEGLLLLTDDKDLAHRLTDPRYEHEKTYLVQVEGAPGPEALAALRAGVMIQGRRTRPAAVGRIAAPALWERPVPIRFRKSVPTSWLEVTLREGRNRQIRRMTAAVGHPCLRIVRTAVGPISLGDLRPGQWRRLSGAEATRLRAAAGSGRSP